MVQTGGTRTIRRRPDRSARRRVGLWSIGGRAGCRIACRRQFGWRRCKRSRWRLYCIFGRRLWATEIVGRGLCGFQRCGIRSGRVWRVHHSAIKWCFGYQTSQPHRHSSRQLCCWPRRAERHSPSVYGRAFLRVLKLLPFFVILAIYMKWIYGSPWTKGPHTGAAGFLWRSIPLLLFLCSGVNLAIALMFVRNTLLFIVFFCFSTVFLICAPVFTFLQYKRWKSK